jgi:hypothetical protein
MIEVQVRAEEPGSAGALRGWLRRDPGVSAAGIRIEAFGSVEETVPSSSGAMGSVGTVASLVESTSGLLALLVAVGAWRYPQRTRPPVVRIVEDDGTVLEGTAEDVLALLVNRRPDRAREAERQQGQGPGPL